MRTGTDTERDMPAATGNTADAAKGDLVVLQEGWACRAKVMKPEAQVLWERGLCVDGASAVEGVPSEERMDLILTNSPDFSFENTAL